MRDEIAFAMARETMTRALLDGGAAGARDA